MRTFPLCLSFLLLTSVANAKTGPHRSAWYIGMGFGNGTASIVIDTPTGEDTKNYDEFFKVAGAGEIESKRLSLSFETGLALTPRLLGGIHLASSISEG